MSSRASLYTIQTPLEGRHRQRHRLALVAVVLENDRHVRLSLPLPSLFSPSSFFAASLELSGHIWKYYSRLSSRQRPALGSLSLTSLHHRSHPIIPCSESESAAVSPRLRGFLRLQHTLQQDRPAPRLKHDPLFLPTPRPRLIRLITSLKFGPAGDKATASGAAGPTLR